MSRKTLPEGWIAPAGRLARKKESGEAPDLYQGNN